MSDTLTRPYKVMPSATPSDADIAAWNELTRDEQLRRMREYLSHPDCSTPSNMTVDEIVARAQARIDARKHG